LRVHEPPAAGTQAGKRELFMQRHLKLTAIAAAVLSTLNVQAAEEAIAPEVIVTATRFSESTQKTASNVTVITDKDIQNSPAMNLPDMLKGIAGIDVRPSTGNMGIDTTVDMRGFGDAASSNTLILLDGQRLNPIDSAGISWSAIPLNSIRRIEIIRGAGTVLYGDQASGGVINIITNKSGASYASATATVGSYGYRGADANLSGGNEQAYFNVATHYADADGWRDNSEMNQQALSGRTGFHLPNGEIFLDFAGYTDKSGLPGSLLSPAYSNSPTSARTPFDSQDRNGYRLRPGASLALSDTMTIEAELANANEKYHSDNVSFGSTFDRARDTLSFTPRLRWKHGLGSLNSETVSGIDYYSGEVKGISSTYAAQGAKQNSKALYLQNTTELNQSWAVALGARRQRMDQRAHQEAYAPFALPAFSGDSVRSRNAYDLGLVYQTSDWRAYAKLGTTFRFANTDELFGYDPFTGNPVFAGDLKPQHGTISEIGASFVQDALRGKASLYQLKLTDEIGFDSAVFANVNLSPTRRNGLEAELDWHLATNLKARFSYTYVDATFREGVNAGNEIPLVAHNKASTQLTWQGGTIGTYSVIANYVGERIYSGDFANILGKLPAYATMDLQSSWDFKPWTITAKLLNAFDKHYASSGGYSTTYSDHYYFPADARSLFVSACYTFR
jgi:iron complex outermembrane receptor protein